MIICTGLDASQEAAAGIEPQQRQIVIAGPGAGKSHVVGALAGNLVDKGVYPEEILVVSFSRVAVGVVRARTAHVVDQGQGVSVSTLDSLAAAIRDELADGDVDFRGYEAGIRHATELLTGARENIFGHLRHLVVDEVQDVVGVRARFVLALLAHAIADDCGFTLLGDPLQSLYDFQLDDGDSLDGAAFLGRVRSRFVPLEREMAGEYRSRSPEAACVAASRPSLTASAPAERLDRLRDMVTDLPTLGDFDRDAHEDIARWPGTTALLCDTNARAALAVDAAACSGLQVELGADLADPALPAWIADLFEYVAATRLDRTAFLTLASSRGVDDPEEKWRLLTALVDDAPGGLDLPRLAGALGRRVDERLRRQPLARVVATTVHRAKGAEFDNVVLVDPECWIGDDGPDASSRRLFVALTRGRARLTYARGVGTKGWCRQNGRATSPMWVRRPFRSKWGAVGVILEASHARHLGPVDHDLSRYVGRPVDWSRTDDLADADGQDVPSWTASVDGVPVARTGPVFGKRLRRFARAPELLPRLSGGRVEGVETVVGTARPGRAGRHGIWHGARVVGPLELDWKVDPE